MQAPADETAPDLALARAAASGDRAALRSVLELVGPSVLAAARSVLGGGHPDVEDVAQEALLGIVKALPSFRGGSSLVHFARRVAVRRAIDGLRNAARARRRSAELDESQAAASEPTMLERKHAMWRRLLAELPAAQAEALVLRAVEGHSIEEIAALSDTPIETVRSRLRLAKAALRERIASDPAFADVIGGDDDRA